MHFSRLRNMRPLNRFLTPTQGPVHGTTQDGRVNVAEGDWSTALGIDLHREGAGYCMKGMEVTDHDDNYLKINSEFYHVQR